MLVVLPLRLLFLKYGASFLFWRILEPLVYLSDGVGLDPMLGWSMGHPVA